MKPKQSELLEAQPKLPWDETDQAQERFQKLVNAVRDAAAEAESVDLDIFFDRYLQTLWSLSLSAPLEYLEGHPFDLEADDEFIFFELENQTRAQAKPLNLKGSQTARKALKLKTPNGALGERFDVFVDGVQLFRPILYRNLPKTKTAVTNPLMFIGQDTEKFEKKHKELSGGPLVFEAYLFWSPRIIPKQHQGVMLRVGNASGTLFDRTFMGYQVSEQTRTRQIGTGHFAKGDGEPALFFQIRQFSTVLRLFEKLIYRRVRKFSLLQQVRFAGHAKLFGHFLNEWQNGAHHSGAECHAAHADSFQFWNCGRARSSHDIYRARNFTDESDNGFAVFQSNRKNTVRARITISYCTLNGLLKAAPIISGSMQININSCVENQRNVTSGGNFADRFDEVGLKLDFNERLIWAAPIFEIRTSHSHVNCLPHCFRDFLRRLPVTGFQVRCHWR
jgi:hypothetical protein